MRKGLSIIFPVYNEQRLLERNINKFYEFMKSTGIPFEIILAENGSRDGSKEICHRLASHNPRMRTFSIKNPSLGKALKKGFQLASYSAVMYYPVDLWGGDFRFITNAYAQLRTYPIVIGSRFIRGSRQKRPFLRKLISQAHVIIVNLVLASSFTDIDAVKMFRTQIAKKIYAKTTMEGSFMEVEICAIIKNTMIPFAEIPINHIESGTRHLNYFLNICFTGVKGIIVYHSRLRQLRI